MKRYLPYALLVAPFAAQASAQNYFEARNSAMGGVGVASSKYKAAAFANPALLTRFGEDDDFGVLLPAVGAFANDPTKQVQWAAFLRRNGLTGLPERFSEAVDVLRTFFEPVLRFR